MLFLELKFITVLQMNQLSDVETGSFKLKSSQWYKMLNIVTVHITPFYIIHFYREVFALG